MAVRQFHFVRLVSARWPRRAAAIVLLALAVFVPRGFYICRSVAPARDAVRYWRAADALREAPFPSSLTKIDCHPLYPAALLVAERAAGLLGVGLSPVARFRLAQTIGAVGYAVFLVVAFLLGSRYLGAGTALIGCVAVAILPKQIEYSTDVLADSLHAMFWTMALAAGAVGLDRRRPAWLFASGGLAVLAYWTRAEGLAAAMGVGAALLLAEALSGSREPWHIRAGRAAAFLAPLVLGVAAYAAIIGGVSPKHSAKVILGAPQVVERPLWATAWGQQVPAFAPLAPAPSPQAAPVDHAAKSFHRRVWSASGRVALELAQELRILWLLLAMVGAWPFATRWAAGPGGRAVLLAVAACLALCFLLRFKAGFLAGRYLMPILPYFAMAGAQGAMLLVRGASGLPAFPWEQKRAVARRDSLRAALATAGLIAATLAISVPGWFDRLHENRADQRQAADWLARRAGADQLVFDPTGLVAFFAGRPEWRPTDDPAADASVRFAVLDVRTPWRAPVDLDPRIARMLWTAAPAASFGKDRRVWIFEVPAATASSGEAAPQ